MKQIVNRLYSFVLYSEDPYFTEAVQRRSAATYNWDAREDDAVFLRMIDQQKAQ